MEDPVPDLTNVVHGLLKNHGHIIGKASGKVFHRRTKELAGRHALLREAVRPLLKRQERVHRQVAQLTRGPLAMARDGEESPRLMTMSGIGPINALAFCAAVDDPNRFRRSRSVGAYFGLTPRGHVSGELDWAGRISKCSDAMVRSYLFEAAGVLLTGVPQWCKLKAWGIRLVKRLGFKKAKVAVAQRLAVVLHRMWREGTDFIWSSREATARANNLPDIRESGSDVPVEV